MLHMYVELLIVNEAGIIVQKDLVGTSVELVWTVLVYNVRTDMSKFV